jgi:hypothetical protein
MNLPALTIPRNGAPIGTLMDEGNGGTKFLDLT